MNLIFLLLFCFIGFGLGRAYQYYVMIKVYTQFHDELMIAVKKFHDAVVDTPIATNSVSGAEDTGPGVER